MPIADATRVGVGMPNVARALGLQAADSSVGTSPAPGQSDPAIEMWPTPIEALTQKASSPSPFTTASFGTPPFAPMSFGLQSFDTVVAPPTTTLDNAREMLRRAGLDRQGGEPRAPGSVKISFTDTGPEQPLGVVGHVPRADRAVAVSSGTSRPVSVKAGCTASTFPNAAAVVADHWFEPISVSSEPWKRGIT